MYDFHIHSDFSADCDTPMETTIKKAIELGLEEICFTEHIDIDYPDPTIDFDLDMPLYDKTLRALAHKYVDDIKVRKGFELGLEPQFIDKYKEMIADEVYDFIICSMHTSDRLDLHSGDFFKGKTVEEAYESYFRELLYCAQHFQDFSILGHLDLVKRYKTYEGRRNFHDIISEIFKIIIPRGQGIELNTSGVRYGLESGMPSRDILELYREHGGEIITLGSDSHIETTLAFQFEESLELLREIGFKYVCSFSDRKPAFHKIDSLI